LDELATAILYFCGRLNIYILWPFGTYILCFGILFSRFGMLYQEKSGNPGAYGCY
jgi:hypothetical protein